jgi:hypothetical protein
LVTIGTISGGDISTGGVNPLVKGRESNQRHEDIASPRIVQTGEQPQGEFSKGEQPQGEIPFSIDVKGGEIETLMRSMSMSVVMTKCFHQCWCFHQCQRGILSDNWFRLMDNWFG